MLIERLGVVFKHTISNTPMTYALNATLLNQKEIKGTAGAEY